MTATLFIIDPQNDFCKPDGSLYVPNADADMQRLAKMIIANADKIDNIIMTADDHTPCDIAHPSFWKTADGSSPAPFTQISANDVTSGKYVPADSKNTKTVIEYLTKLQAKCKTHTIWPTHCISGSIGACIYEPILQAAIQWSIRMQKNFSIIRKGQYPLTEHYGAFEAEVPYANEISTQFNHELATLLYQSDTILIAGEAKSHCVANTIKQMSEKADYLIPKLHIVEDAMSPVTGFEHEADNIITNVLETGASTIKTTDII